MWLLLLTPLLLLIASYLLAGPGVAEWSCLQIFRSVAGRSILSEHLNAREEAIWANWEMTYRQDIHAREGMLSTLLEIPVITSISQLDLVDLSRPFLAKNMSTAEALTIQDLLSLPVSQLEIDFFTDARRRNTVPDARGLVGDIVGRIVKGGPEKFGTQMILKTFPEIMGRFLDYNPWLAAVFGDARVGTWRAMGATVTAPVFVSRGRAVDVSKKSLDETTRTDLHCEPISNLVGQTAGEKLWTLVEPKYSYLLRPTVAPDGRAYFYSSLDPFDPAALAHVPRYEVLTQQGDVLYVPTWTWHRIQYLPNVTAASISIFEFVPSSFLQNNAVFALSLIPNLIKEVAGIKTQ